MELAYFALGVLLGDVEADFHEGIYGRDKERKRYPGEDISRRDVLSRFVPKWSPLTGLSHPRRCRCPVVGVVQIASCLQASKETVGSRSGEEPDAELPSSACRDQWFPEQDARRPIATRKSSYSAGLQRTSDAQR